MDIDILKNYIKDGKSLNEISKLTSKSLSSIRYWVDKYCIETNFLSFKQIGKKEYQETRYCPRCKKDILTSNFYQRRGKSNSSTYCKSCTSDQTLERMRDLKCQMINYKGGKCSKCGYKKYQGALEFHHLDPKEKDFNPSSLKRYKFNELVKSELDKCILVCSNCHREIHDYIKSSPAQNRTGIIALEEQDFIR